MFKFHDCSLSFFMVANGWRYEVVADYGANTYQFTPVLKASDNHQHPETPAMPYDRGLAVVNY
jgi:hypothetical protein